MLLPRLLVKLGFTEAWQFWQKGIPILVADANAKPGGMGNADWLGQRQGDTHLQAFDAAILSAVDTFADRHEWEHPVQFFRAYEMPTRT